MALLEVRDLSVCIHYNKTRLEAVKGISFDIRSGEIIALAGESGGGKTLTGLSVLNVLPPAAEIGGGNIFFDSASLTSCTETELRSIRGKDISMIFQESRQSLNPLLRIGGQITETLELHGEKDRSGNRAAALDMLARMGFNEPEKIYRAYPHQLSPGMCQRVMIAIASICKPKLLIADEATNSLDSTSRDQVLDLLRRMNREHNTAILFITHDLLLVRRICRRIMIMYAGKIIEEGPVDAVCDAPAHPYTQALIAAIPGKRGTPLPEISGKSPSIEDRITGCPFAGRCTHAAARCRAQFPPAVRRGDNHTVHCVRAEAGNV